MMMLKPDLFDFAFVPDWYGQLNELREMALPEPWRFKKPMNETKNQDTPILERYLHIIFRKQCIEFNFHSTRDIKKSSQFFHVENERACFHLIYLQTEAHERKNYRSDLYALRRVLEDVGNLYERQSLSELFLSNDFPSTPRHLFKFYSDAEIKRLTCLLHRCPEAVYHRGEMIMGRNTAHVRPAADIRTLPGLFTLQAPGTVTTMMRPAVD